MTKKHTKPKKNKFPSFYALVKNTLFEVITFWRPLLAILAVYAVIYFVFVLGLSLSNNSQDLMTGGSKIGDALNVAFGQFFGGVLIGTAASDTTLVVQFILFLVASLAFIWTLRKLQGLKKIKIKDAYYLGNAALIPVIIISLVLILTFIPALIGSTILTVSIQSASTLLETVIVSVLAFVLLMLSLYLFVMFWPAFYIVTLPKNYPLGALKASIKITKKRRLLLLRKIFLWFVLLPIVMFVLLVLGALIWEAVVPSLAFILFLASFGLSHAYLYMLYRELL
jgi:hypothetical protein